MQWSHYIQIRFINIKKPANGLQLAGLLNLVWLTNRSLFLHEKQCLNLVALPLHSLLNPL